MRKKLLKSEFSKNVFILLTGTSIAQLVPILLTPVLSRLFTPEEFGVFAFYSSLVTFLSIFATGRYELAILLPKEQKDAVNILGLSFLVLISFTILTSLLSFFLSGYLFSFERIRVLGVWLYLIPLLVFFLGGVNIFTAWNNRNKKFGITSLSKITMYGSDGVSSALIGFNKNAVAFNWESIKSVFSKSHIISSKFGWHFQGLILSKFIGLFASFLYLGGLFFKNQRHLLKDISKSEMKSMSKIHRDFPRINMLHALTDELKTSGLSLIILTFFFERILGIYNMTYRILRAPLSIIGTSFSQVFYQNAAEKYANKELITPFVKRTTQKLFLIGLPLFVLIFLFAPVVFTFVLGEKWSEAGVYARYLTPWLFVNFVVSPVSQLAIILKKQFAFWMINLFSNILIFVAILLAGTIFKDIKIGFIIISASQVIFYLWVYFWLIKTSTNAEKNY